MKTRIITTLIILSIILTGCGKSQIDTDIVSTETVEISFDDEDFVTEYDSSNVYKVTFNGMTVSADKGKLSNSEFTITEEGTYYLTGNFKGNVIIDSDGLVRLIFDNLEITSTLNSPIFVKNAEKIIITLKEGSNNTLTDTLNYNLNSDEEPSATIFSKDDLVINGTGTLNINSNYNDAIQSKDGLKIISGTYNITSVDDAIIGKDYVAIKNGTFNINAGGDGIKSTNEEDGNILIENGTFNIVSINDGIDSKKSLSITDGTFKITTGGGSINASTKSDWGMWGNKSSTTTSSAKGLKAKNDIIIQNAKITIDSSDDSIHSNDNITIQNGTYNLSSGDDGIHADTTLTIEDGTINITKSYEGLEGSNIFIKNGTIYIISSDDGINVAGGSDSSSMGRPGANTITASSGKLEISGGYIYVDASGDGLDSNGNMYLTGGLVIVNGPTDNGNGALDYDGEFIVTGGQLIAAGSSGMLQTPGTSSTINTISVVSTSYMNEGTIINISDSKGDTILSFSPSKKFNSLVYTSSTITKGSTYSISYGGTDTGTNKDGMYASGKYTNGTSLGTVTISSSITSLGRSNSMGGQPQGGRR